ncbi:MULTISPECIES: alginate lyase family protein [Pontibacillus]|uniref:Alginate lyase family protein n=1 Tax=Pontibacillus chungwhensis TaxID=265426 RepID=A0ABY8UV20_9BACI|nr:MULTISPECIES: alginate lyase family protein [Pontibacillus]MCD5322836.1 heparinase II/III family protein [Pontibacillus sp. HN14]WIF96234.1 alginate lyase family protein [Pontibacillus chungwhensis]
MKKRFFYEEDDREEIITFCQTRWPEETKEVIQRSDLACNQTFIFTHRWDMERCETPVSFPDKVDWTYRFQGDFEWTVNLNRSRFMAELGQSYWLTGDEKYVTAYKALLDDWISQNPLSVDEIYESKIRAFNVKDTWRKLDSGIRITNWLKGYHCIKESAQWTTEDNHQFKEAVYLHGTYLSMAYTAHDAQSNWGFLETNGLFQIALLFPEFPEAKKWLNLASERLANMCQLQIFEDGMHNEQSPMYHHEVLHCLFEPLLLAKLNDVSLPSICEKSLEQLFQASLSIVKPSGHQPMISDSDHTDIRDLLGRGAVFFQRGDLKHQSYRQLDFESAWYYGGEGISAFQKLKSHPPSKASIHLPQSGYSIMRTGWSRDSHYCLFDGGHMDIIQAHGHDDFLHLEMSVFGEDMLVDTGRYTYMEGRERRYFKESIQHNTTIVDHTSISEYIDSWEWGRIARPTQSYWKSCEDFDYVQCGHDGYRTLADPVQVMRKVLFVKPYYWIVVDEFHSNKQHHFAQHFHLSEKLTIQTETEHSKAICKTENLSGLMIQSLTGANLTEEACWISRHYNEKQPSTKLVFEAIGSGTTRMITVFIPYKYSQPLNIFFKEIEVRNTFGEPFKKADVTALEIKVEEDTHYALISHSGPNSFQFGNEHMTGEVLLVKEEEVGKRKWIVKV